MTKTSPAIDYVSPSGIRVRRLQPAIGAQLSGVDLTKPLPATIAEDIRRALWAHGVIFFRDQPIAYEGHLELAEVFGEPMPEVGLDPERPCLSVLKAETGKQGDAFGHWHSDGTWAPKPPSISILRAVKAAELGGDTWFSCARAAYRGLPEEVKARIAPLRGRASLVHGARHTADREKIAAMLAAYPPVEHPIVRIHPVTGAPALYVNENHTVEIEGMENAEGKALLDYLTLQFTRPEHQVAWGWRDNSIAIWDNAAVQHYAVPGHIGFRHMERIRVAGGRPVGITEAAPGMRAAE